MLSLDADLLFTLAACGALLGMWGLTALLLPWSDSEQDQVERELRELAGRALPPSPSPAPAPLLNRRRAA